MKRSKITAVVCLVALFAILIATALVFLRPKPQPAPLEAPVFEQTEPTPEPTPEPMPESTHEPAQMPEIEIGNEPEIEIVPPDTALPSLSDFLGEAVSQDAPPREYELPEIELT